MTSPLNNMVVVVAGAAGPAGVAATTALLTAGATVVAVGHSPNRLATLAASLPGLLIEAVDLTDQDEVIALASRVRAAHGRIDGLIHLVGGYRSGSSFTANSDADWQFLSSSLVDTLRHTTVAFHDDLVRSPAGRVAIVSARAAAKPGAGSANYAAAKAAAEAWMLALADSFRHSAPADSAQGAAAVIFVIKALVTPQMRTDAATPDITVVPKLPVLPGIPTLPGIPKVPGFPGVPAPPTIPGMPTVPGSLTVPGLPGAAGIADMTEQMVGFWSAGQAFPGFTDVADLADRIVELWSADAAEINGTRIDLTA